MRTKHKYSVTERREIIKFFAFIGIPFIGLILFYYLPASVTFIESFTNKSGVGGKYDFIWFQNYVTMFHDKVLWDSMLRTLVYAVCTGPVSLIISLVVALLLNTNVKGAGIFRYIYLLVFVLPSFATVAMYKSLFDPTSGLVNKLLALVGITGPGWYKVSSTAMLTVILTAMFGFGFKMLLFYSALRNISASYYEAARLEGASSAKMLFTITIPMISPVLFLNIVLTLIDSFKAFDLPYLFGGDTGAPANSLLVFSMYLRNIAFSSPYRYGYGAALAMAFFVMMLVLTVINFILSKLYVNEDWD